MLHGCTQNPDDFAAGTGMNDVALQRGFCVLYPAQSPRINPQRCWNWFKRSHQQRGRGEAALLAEMTRDVTTRHAIDASRVYVAGLSAGGAMAAALGAAYPDVYAAVGVHSGLAAGIAADLPSALAAMQGGAATAAHDGASGMPTIVFHGDADATVHPANGARVVAASVGDATTVEIEHRAADGTRACTRRIHRAGDGRVVAEHWLVHGAPHAWSGGRPAGSYTDVRGPDATAEMVRFFGL
jgi:poly(hydroxyalkanoate) depolymerase family esterase